MIFLNQLLEVKINKAKEVKLIYNIAQSIYKPLIKQSYGSRTLGIKILHLTFKFLDLCGFCVQFLAQQ